MGTCGGDFFLVSCWVLYLHFNFGSESEVTPFFCVDHEVEISNKQTVWVVCMWSCVSSWPWSPVLGQISIYVMWHDELWITIYESWPGCDRMWINTTIIFPHHRSFPIDLQLPSERKKYNQCPISHIIVHCLLISGTFWCRCQMQYRTFFGIWLHF